jgi:hypothetical protein
MAAEKSAADTLVPADVDRRRRDLERVGALRAQFALERRQGYTVRYLDGTGVEVEGRTTGERAIVRSGVVTFAIQDHDLRVTIECRRSPSGRPYMACTELAIRARPDGVGVTASALRLPASGYIGDAVQLLTETNTERGSSTARLSRAAGHRARGDIDRVAIAAEHYLAAAAAGDDRLYDRVMAALRAAGSPSSYANARQLVREARARGLVPPGRRGRRPTSAPL